jgi:hypothetical protein
MLFAEVFLVDEDLLGKLIDLFSARGVGRE